jgi:hypothetical protein
MLRKFHHESPRGLCQGDDVVTLTKQIHWRTVEGTKDLVIGRELVRVKKGFTRDRGQRAVEHPLAHPAGPTVTLVAVIGRQRSLEHRLESIGAGTVLQQLVSARNHVASPTASGSCGQSHLRYTQSTGRNAAGGGAVGW